MNLRRFLIFFSVVWILGIVLFCYAKLVETRSLLPWQLDFAKFHVSAQALIDGEDIYRRVPSNYFGPLSSDAEFAPEWLHPNLNLPFVTVLLSPFGLLDFATALAVWTAISIVFLLATACLLAKEIGMLPWLHNLPSAIIAGVLAILLLVYYPNWIGAALGQLGQPLLFVLSAAWVSARREHDRTSGLLFGLALTLKPFTGVFLLLLPWLGRWQLLRWYVASFVLFTGIAAAIAGPEAYIHYLAALREVSWHTFGWNASLMAPITLFVGGGIGPSVLELPWLRLPIWLAMSACLYAILVFQLHKLRKKKIRLDVAVAAGVPLMLLISPLGWLYYFVLIWITAAAVLLATEKLSHRIWWGWSSFFVLVLCGLPYPFTNASDDGQTYGSMFATSGDTGALLVAFALVIVAAWHLRKRECRSRNAAGTGE